MAEMGFVHGTCQFNDGGCTMFCMLFTPKDDVENTCKICDHLKQLHGVGDSPWRKKVTPIDYR